MNNEELLKIIVDSNNKRFDKLEALVEKKHDDIEKKVEKNTHFRIRSLAYLTVFSGAVSVLVTLIATYFKKG